MFSKTLLIRLKFNCYRNEIDDLLQRAPIDNGLLKMLTAGRHSGSNLRGRLIRLFGR